MGTYQSRGMEISATEGGPVGCGWIETIMIELERYFPSWPAPP